MSDAPTTTQLLTMLLATESFMLAVVGLAINLASPGQKGVRSLLVPAGGLAAIAVVTLILAAIGGIVAWFSIYGGGGVRPFPECLIAGIVLLVIIVQPFLAVLIALGMRFDE